MVTIREDGRERRVTAAEAFLLQLTQKGLDVDLPIETKPPAVTEPNPQIMLELTADRQVAVNKQPVTMERLEEFLRAVYEARSDKTMFVAAAGKLRYADVIHVIDAAKGAGVEKVGIVTERMRGGT